MGCCSPASNAQVQSCRSSLHLKGGMRLSLSQLTLLRHPHVLAGHAALLASMQPDAAVVLAFCSGSHPSGWVDFVGVQLACSALSEA